MKIGDTYQFKIINRSLNYSGKRCTITNITKTTVWFAYEGQDDWLYTTQFNLFAEPVSPWSGNVVKHNFV